MMNGYAINTLYSLSLCLVILVDDHTRF